MSHHEICALTSFSLYFYILHLLTLGIKVSLSLIRVHSEKTFRYNWTTNPDGMAHTWRACIAANADKDMIWTVGLRGLWDYTYCPGDITQAACGEMLSGAIANQTAWIREAQPNAKIIT